MVGEPAEWPGTLRRSVEICVAASRAGVVELSILGAAQNYSESWLEELKPSTSGSNLLGPCKGGHGSKESPCMEIDYGNCHGEQPLHPVEFLFS